ncbi:MAG: hypothetical protein IGS48_20470 [Oscillatoriales cyanobacterium C42_A2020_001]|nr:hypothetical protein [Leptolyngbyaceae cyanobacterium C42_A2020_001]
MQYAILYKPQRNPRKPWFLKIWEPVPTRKSGDKAASYLFNAQYWLSSQAEAKATLTQYQKVHGILLGWPSEETA